MSPVLECYELGYVCGLLSWMLVVLDSVAVGTKDDTPFDFSADSLFRLVRSDEGRDSSTLISRVVVVIETSWIIFDTSLTTTGYVLFRIDPPLEWTSWSARVCFPMAVRTEYDAFCYFSAKCIFPVTECDHSTHGHRF